MNQSQEAAAANPPPHNRRRQRIVNATFQWKHAITIGLAVFLLASLMSSALYGILHHQARQRIVNPTSYTAEVGMIVFVAGLCFAALTAGGLTFWFLIVTHRICGPLSVIGRHLIVLGEGRFPTIRPLRRKDEFKDLYTIFSRTVDGLKAKKQSELTKLREALELARSATQADDETRRTVLDSLEARIDTMCRETARGLDDPQEASPPEPAKRSEPTPVAICET